MFTVQRFRGGFALVWYDHGTRRRRTLSAKDRQSAEAEARTIWRAAQGGAWTVGRCMSAYLETIAHKTSHTRRQDAWKAMRGFWERINPALIDDAMCKAYRARRQVSDATARYELLQISTALGWAAKERFIPQRPAIWLPAIGQQKIRHLTRVEFARFFAEVKADHARLYVAIGLYTMARPSAILSLTWDRVDFARRLIDFTPPGHVRTSKRRAVVAIADALLPYLERGFAARTCDMVIERGGEAIRSIKKAFQAASDRSGIHATPYTLRHTGAVWAAEAGASMDELAQFMGHRDATTTAQHYARFSPGYLAKVANAIGSI